MAFYWINNNDELVTCYSLSEDQKILLTEQNLINIEWRTAINNKRQRNDSSSLYEEYWEGMRTGIDGYPIKGRFNKYLIAGGNN